MLSMRVLIVEDEDAIAQPLAEGLARAGFDPVRVDNGTDAISAVTGDRPDVVLLDLRLPDIDGFAVCRQIRTTSDVPIIIVSSLDDEVDRVVGLEIGADDYVVKPFGIRELVARIRAVTRRTFPEKESDDDTSGLPLKVGRLSIAPEARTAYIDNLPIDLTRLEFDLLARLVAEPGVPVSREHLMRDVWKTNWYGSGKTIDVHVGTLRRKVGDAVAIDAIRGFGYRVRPAA